MIRPHLLLAAGLAAAQLLGCASTPQSQRSVLAGSAVQNLLILPLNLAVAMPSELDLVSHRVWEELELYLRAHGKQLKTVSYRDARPMWIRSIRQVRAGEKGSEADYDDAARALVLELAQHAEFDTVIAPSLYIKEARIAGRDATWDGVTRRLEIEAYGDTRSLAATMPLEGSAPAASLHAVILDARGNKIQERSVGLELLVGVRAMPKTGSHSNEPTFKFTTRTDLFANREHVREGIAGALAPLLPPLPSP